MQLKFWTNWAANPAFAVDLLFVDKLLEDCLANKNT